MTTRVSLAMLAEKDSPTLSRCLDSVVDLASEIVVVTQPGATAAWADSLRSSGVKLVEFPWCDDFSAARNESLKHATGDWILYLDADEWLDDENSNRLQELLRCLPQPGVVGYTLSQVSREYSGRARSLEQVRLFRNLRGVSWIYRVHEQIAPSLKRAGGEILSSDIEIAHDGYVNRAALAAKGRRNARLVALDLQERPDDPFVLYNAGVMALDAGHASKAALLLGRSVSQRNTARVSPPLDELYSALARALSFQGDQNAALAACREGLTHLPQNPELVFVEGTLLLQTGNLPDAEDRLRRCLNLRPSHGLAWQVLTDLLLTNRRHAEAAEIAARLRLIDGMAVDAAVCTARVELARGNCAIARETLEDAIAAHPNAILLHELYATVLIFLKKSSAARSALTRLLELDPAHAWAERTLAGLSAEPRTELYSTTR